MPPTILRPTTDTNPTRPTHHRARPTPAGTDTDPELPPGDPSTAFHRARLYALIAHGLDRPHPTTPVITRDAWADQLVESAHHLDPALATAADTVRTAATTAPDPRGDWVGLFGLETGRPVSPYELTYHPGPLVTNIRQLADITGFYHAFEMALAADARDRADHICTETEFMSHLCLREAYHRHTTDPTGLRVVVDAQQAFIEDHLGRWTHRFATAVTDETPTPTAYAAIARLLALLVDHDATTLDATPDPVPDDPVAAEWTTGIFGDSGRDCGGCGLPPPPPPPGPDPNHENDPTNPNEPE